MHEFGISILPIVLRNTTNFVPIVQKILQLEPSSGYKSARKILRMIKLVSCLEESKRPIQEAPILSLIAEFALKAQDFDYCLSICDLMMEKPSKEAVAICLKLVNSDEFADLTAKARLTSFCVNYCDDEEIEDMLLCRISLLDEGKFYTESLNMQRAQCKKFQFFPAACACAEVGVAPNNRSNSGNKEEQEQAQATKVEDSDSSEMKSALSKITEPESLSLPSVIIPDSTKVISSLFGKLSKFAAMNSESEQAQNDDDDGMMEQLEMIQESPRKKAKSVSINVFYQDTYPSAKLGQLSSNLESFSATLTNSPLDNTTWNLLSRHYRNSFESDEDNFISWDILSDILQVILTEDTPLGLSFLASHLHSESFDLSKAFKGRPKGLGLYLAGLESLSNDYPSKKLFDFPPGIIFCWCKKHCQNSHIFKNASLTFIENDSQDDDLQWNIFEIYLLLTVVKNLKLVFL